MTHLDLELLQQRVSYDSRIGVSLDVTMPTPKRAEEQLRSLLRCLPDDLEGFEQATTQIDSWPLLFEAADLHCVGAVILSALGALGGGVSPASTAPLRRKIRLESVRQHLFGQTLREILAKLYCAGIGAIPLKGPLLAARLYGDHVVRPSSDLDVLVAVESIEHAAAALRPVGYWLEGGALGRFFRKNHHHVHLMHSTLPVVELHFEAYRGFGTSIPAEPLLARSIPADLSAWAGVRVLAPEDEFIYLAVHAASHRFQRLGWLFDLKLFCRRHPNTRWGIVAERAEGLGLFSVVSFACTLLSRWLGVPPNPLCMSRVGRPRQYLAEELSRRRSTHGGDAVTSFLFSALLCDDWVRAALFAQRFLRTKLRHEAPIRLRSLFSD